MPHPETRVYRTHVMTPRPYAPRGYVGAAFKEVVFGESAYEAGYLTGWEADLLLARAVAKGRSMCVLMHGAISISPPRRDIDADRSASTARSLRLDPTVHPKELTERQYQDLKLIEQYEHRSRAVHDDRGLVTAIDAGFYRIPRTQASILMARGWISQLPHSSRVWISSAGRMALAWRWRQEQELNSRLLRGLYLDAALTAAATARSSLAA